MNRLSIVVAAMAASIISFLSIPRSGLADTLIVPADYTTIQSAIDASSDGDVVLVADGTYIGTGNQYIDFKGKSISLQSENGPELCVIDLENKMGFLFTSYSGQFLIDGFTIANAMHTEGGAIKNTGSKTLTVTNCLFLDCDYRSIHVQNDTTIIENCRFDASGFTCRYTSWPKITDTIFENGYGLRLNACSPTLTNVVISGVQAGAGVFGEHGSWPIIVNSTITGNLYGIQADFSSEHQLKLFNSIVYNNVSGQVDVPETAVTAKYNDVQGGLAGEGNMDADPVFVDAENGDFRLSEGSPCLNSGASDAVLYHRIYAPDHDVLSHPRPLSDGFDIGAHESAVSLATPELVGSWSMDGELEYRILDDSQYGNHGFVHGAKRVETESGTALEFDGEDDWVRVPDGNGLDVSSEITMAAWVCPEEFAESFGASDIVLYQACEYYLVITHEGWVGVLSHGLSPRIYYYSRGGIETGRWSHIAATYNSADEKIRIYINGRLDNEIHVSGQIPSWDNDLYMGVHFGNPPYMLYHGKLDDVRIYSEALSDCDIEKLYRNSPYSYDPIVPPPQKTTMKGRNVELNDSWTIIVDKADDKMLFIAEELQKKLACSYDVALEIHDCQEADHEDLAIVVGNPYQSDFVDGVEDLKGMAIPVDHHSQGYMLDADKDGVLVAGIDSQGLFYGVQTLLQLIEADNGEVAVQACRIEDWPDIELRAMQLFEIRGMDEAKAKIDELASMKMNMAFFSTRHLWDLDGMDLDDALNNRQVYQELLSYCRDRYIEPVPEWFNMGVAYGVLKQNPHCAEGFWVQDEPFRFDAENNGYSINDIELPVLNPGFENDTNNDGIPDGWTIDGDDWEWVEEGRGGGSCMKVHLPEPESGSDYQISGSLEYVVDVEPDTYYSMTFWAKQEGACEESDQCHAPAFRARELDENGKALTLQTDQVTIPEDAHPCVDQFFDQREALQHNGVLYSGSGWNQWDNNWRRGEVNFKTDSRCRKLELRATIYKGYGTAWFDDISLKRLNSMLVNVIKTDTKSIVVKNADGSVIYQEGVDYTVEDGVMEYPYEIDNTPTSVRRIDAGAIGEEETVLLDYDSVVRFAPYSTWSIPYCPSEPAVYDIIRDSVEDVIQSLEPKAIQLGIDEVRGMNRDSRCLDRETALSNSELLAHDIDTIYGIIKDIDEDIVVSMWDDMVNPCDNGGDPYYQKRLGGAMGYTYPAIDYISDEIVMNNWWYSEYDDYGKMEASPDFYASKCLSWIGSAFSSALNTDGWIRILKREENGLGISGTTWYGWQDVYGTIRHIAHESWTTDPEIAGPVPVGSWSMDDIAGSVAHDSSENQNDGRIYGATWTEAVNGYGLLFDGDGDYLEVADDPSLNMTEELTVTALIRVNSWEGSDEYATIAQKFRGGTPGEGYVLCRLENANNIALQVRFFDGEALRVTPSLAENTWYHIAGVFDGTSIKMYVNGSEDGSFGYGQFEERQILPSSQPLHIGGLPGKNSFDGAIDEVRVYDRALSADFILQQAQKMLPAASFPMNENSGTTLHDASPNGNDGAIHGGEWAEGHSGQALQFRGLNYNDYVSIADSDSLNITDSLTLSAWVKVSDWSQCDNYARIAEKFTGGYPGAGFLLCRAGAGNALIFQLRTQQGTIMRWTPELPENTWYHIAGVFDGSKLRLYVNGSEENTTGNKILQERREIINHPSSLYIGGRNEAYRFCGLIDDVKVFDAALTSEEVNDLMRTQINRPPEVELAEPTGEVFENVTVSISATASDIEGGSLSCSWFASAGRISWTGQEAEFTAPDVVEPTDVTITVTVIDEQGASTTATRTVTVLPSQSDGAATETKRLYVFDDFQNYPWSARWGSGDGSSLSIDLANSSSPYYGTCGVALQTTGTETYCGVTVQVQDNLNKNQGEYFAGRDFTGAASLHWAMKGENGGEVVTIEALDSKLGQTFTLSNQWQSCSFKIETSHDLSSVRELFSVKVENNQRVEFSIDEIYFEVERERDYDRPSFPAFVRGVGYNYFDPQAVDNFPLASDLSAIKNDLSANTLRFWNQSDYTHNTLDNAYENGLKTILGYWIPRGDDGLCNDYSDEKLKAALARNVENLLEFYLPHPGAIAIVLGNEVFGQLDDAEEKTAYASLVNELSLHIHENFGDILTTCAVADTDLGPGLDPVDYLKAHAPDLDLYGVNAYGGVENAIQDAKDSGYGKPILLLEYGCLGHWETDWDNYTDAQRADDYAEHWNILLDEKTLGGCAFAWIDKTENDSGGTPRTGWGMVDADRSRRLQFDAIAQAYAAAHPDVDRIRNTDTTSLYPSFQHYYSSFGSALAGASETDTDTIQFEQGAFSGTFIMSENKRIVMEGGYDPDFSIRTGHTEIENIVVEKGTVLIDGIILR